MDIIPEPLPEAEPLSYPEAGWDRRFFNVFDWFRAQPHWIRKTAIEQWAREGKAHLLEPYAEDATNRCETWYSEQGRFFIRVWVKDGVLQEKMTAFQGESVLAMYGHSVAKVKREMLNGKPVDKQE